MDERPVLDPATNPSDIADPHPDAPLPADPAPDRVITGHRYDGIREYDNPMPRWWLWLFWASIAWSPLYVLAVHVFDWIPTYGERLAAQTEQLEEVRTTFAASNPTFSTEPAALAEYAANPDNAAAGAAVYASAACVACHGDKGQGLIGPNLTDEYWIHGAKAENLFTVLTNGVLEKGMPAQQATLSDEQRGQLVAYIFSLKGTNPPGAKAPQGDKADG